MKLRHVNELCSWCQQRPVAPTATKTSMGAGPVCDRCNTLPYGQGGARFVFKPRWREHQANRNVLGAYSGRYTAEVVDRAYNHRTVAGDEIRPESRFRLLRRLNVTHAVCVGPVAFPGAAGPTEPATNDETGTA